MGRKKILLVDDNKDLIKLFKAALEKNDYSVITLSDANKVRQAAEKEEPDLILLDIIMPGMSGYEVCEEIKTGSKTGNIPIILLTGKELEPSGIAERCMGLGAEGFFIKPFDINKLLSKIEEILS